MKKNITALIAICMICLVLTGCAETEGATEIDVDFTALSSIMVEAEFVNIIVNSADYLGKTIRVRGPLTTMFFNDQVYHYVIMIPGDICCPPDGFEFRLGEGQMALNDYFRQGEMIEVTGELSVSVEQNFRLLYLSVSDIDEITVVG